MAIGAYFGSGSMSAQKYADVVQKLEAAGVGSPKGRRYHASFGDPNDLHVFDVWASQEEFDAFTFVERHPIGAIYERASL